jgi:hypothetical protein
MKHNTEVITTTDKDQRDRMYEDLRKHGDDLERQVVRFSDCEPTDEVEQVWYERGKKFHTRPVYRSTWGLAYPRS